MFKKNKISKVPVYQLRDENGELVKRAIDQFYAQEFCIGPNGFPESDITLLMRATTQKEYEMIAARLQEIKKTNPDNSKKSDKQIISEIWPRGFQTPSEIDSFMEYFNQTHTVEPQFEKPDITTKNEEPSPAPAPTSE